MSVTERLDRFQQRHQWAGFPLAVGYKFFDDQGNYLAALITYYGFLSFFPLLLLFSSILGFILQGDADLQEQILNSTLSQFPVIGEQLSSPSGLHGSTTAVVVGIIGSLYGALGVAQATQNAMNSAWSVPRNRRPNPIAARLRSLLLLLTVGLAIVGTTVLSALGSSGSAFGANLGLGTKILATLLSVALNAVVFVLAFKVSTAHKLSARDAAPGAVTAAVIWQVLQSFGTAYVGHVVKDASVTNAVFAIVLGLIAWIYLGAVTVVMCVEINVVRTQNLYPRALMAPFTEDVTLTRADQRAYSGQATAQKTKDVETVDVSFDGETQVNADARQEDAP